MMGRPLLVARGTPAALARTAVDVNPVCVSVSMNLNRSFTQPWPLVTPSTRVAVTPRSAAGGTSGSGADDLAASAATRGIGGSASERSDSEILSEDTYASGTRRPRGSPDGSAGETIRE